MFDLGRLLTGLATAAAVLMGAALGVPALMDWEHLRAPAQARAQALTGAPVRIDGRITVQLLPAPRLTLGNVVMEPAPGRAVSGTCARVHVRFSFAELLAGKARPAALTLSGADLLIDRAASEGDRISLLPLPVDVKDGQLRFEPGGEAEITRLTFSAQGPGREGERPLRISGAFAEAPFAIRAVLDGEGNLRSAALDFGEGSAALSVARVQGGTEIALRLTRGGEAMEFLGRLLPALGRVVRPDQAAQLGPLAMTLRAAPDGDAFALQALEVTAGQLRLTGGGRFRPGARPALDLELGARTLVLGGGESGLDVSGLLRVLGQAAEWGGSLDGGLRLYADHILAAGAVMRGGDIRLAFGPEGARLRRFRLALPGGLALSGRGVAAEPGLLAADFRLDAARANGAEGGAGATALKARGRLILSGARAVLRDVVVEAGRNVLQGEGAIFFGARTALEMRAEADEVDLRPCGLAWGGLISDLSPERAWGALRDLAAEADVTARLELGAVRFTDAVLRDGILDLALDREQVVLRRLSVEEVGGRMIEARLRAPFPSPGEGAGEAQGLPARAEAAIEVRPAEAQSRALAWRASLWDGMLSLETDAPLRARLSGRLAHKGDHIQWADVEGRIGKAAVHGDLALVPGARALLHGAVRLETTAIALRGEDGALWPDWKPAEYWPGDFNIRLDWSADDLTVAGARLTGAKGTAALEGDTARLVLTSGRLFGGAASGAASLRVAPDGAAHWETQGVVQQADLALVMGRLWQGRGLIRQSTSGSGASVADIVAGLRGTVGVSFEQGRIGGFDAAALAASLSGRDGAEAWARAADRAFGAGWTPFRRLEGEARIGNGEISLSGIGAQTDRGPVMLTGVISLPARLIAAQADISLRQGAPPLSVQFIGRMEAPDRVVAAERPAGQEGE